MFLTTFKYTVVNENGLILTNIDKLILNWGAVVDSHLMKILLKKSIFKDFFSWQISAKNKNDAQVGDAMFLYVICFRQNAYVSQEEHH